MAASWAEGEKKENEKACTVINKLSTHLARLPHHQWPQKSGGSQQYWSSQGPDHGGSLQQQRQQAGHLYMCAVLPRLGQISDFLPELEPLPQAASWWTCRALKMGWNKAKWVQMGGWRPVTHQCPTLYGFHTKIPPLSRSENLLNGTSISGEWCWMLNSWSQAWGQRRASWTARRKENGKLNFLVTHMPKAHNQSCDHSPCFTLSYVESKVDSPLRLWWSPATRTTPLHSWCHCVFLVALNSLRPWVMTWSHPTQDASRTSTVPHTITPHHQQSSSSISSPSRPSRGVFPSSCAFCTSLTSTWVYLSTL